ncbi:hypothetical protein L1049_020295 [Liquidambar formosana]|uniref:Protein kinase domain-containing protein n=1 Tax=Liquidambar formosana TaxID=63359 RepID=A0AAP0X3M7_LIQFO
MLEGIRLAQYEYLRTTGFFLSPNVTEVCWDSYQVLVDEFIPGFDIQLTCGFDTSLMSEGCVNITSRWQFESLIPESILQEVRHSCNRSLEDAATCLCNIRRRKEESSGSKILILSEANSFNHVVTLTGDNAIYLCQFICILFWKLGLGFSFSGFILSIANGEEISPNKLAEASCPMDFDFLRKLVLESGPRSSFIDISSQCRYILEGMRLVRSQYLRTDGYFLPPSNASKACWDSYGILISQLVRNFDIRSACGYHPEWVSEGCMNIRSRSEFETLVPEPAMREIRSNCKKSLHNSSHCAFCTNTLSSIEASYFAGPKIQNASDCARYPFMYAAALVNPFGPADRATAKCLFSLEFFPRPSNTKQRRIVTSGLTVGCAIMGFLGVFAAAWFLWALHKKMERKKKDFAKIELSSVSMLGSISGSKSLVRFKYEEIKEATLNFSRENIIGKGRYGNVYKGALLDGSEVALKRFKNCSAFEDATFAHEVEVIASVKHVNLVALRGYCTATIPMEGHQRIIAVGYVFSGFTLSIASGENISYKNPACPLDLDVLRNLILDSTQRPTFLDVPSQCRYIFEGMCLIRSEYLRTNGYFLLPSNASKACWASYRILVSQWLLWLIGLDQLIERLPSVCSRLNFCCHRSSSSVLRRRIVVCSVLIGCAIVFLGVFVAVWFLWAVHKEWEGRKRSLAKVGAGLFSRLRSIHGSTSSVRFKYEEIKQATQNFSRKNIIGIGRYGNVYKGILPDGSEVAIKRFKNCSAFGDATFANEVEVIASVKHVNLLALRGYCTAAIPVEGHQRIILICSVNSAYFVLHLWNSDCREKI